ncbi:MAG: type 1 glutamine amidotransferase domain-containing protein [Bryobacterales bacterium]|nr:type 1 glutamine amidotransferase domain-containing protein [Bryobacterales bacterium]
MTKRILLIAASPATSTTLNIPVGFWASELIHPWYEFTEAGYQIEIASPAGGRIELDSLSDPRDASGYSAHDILSRGFLQTPQCASLLDNTRKLAETDPASFDALLVCGGQSPMFTFRGDTVLQSVVAAFFEAGKPTAALCHGVAALIDVKLADGSYLIAGKTITGFANVEEDIADSIVGTKVMPWRIEEAARERGANYIQAGAWKPFAVRDGNLITGQQQYSGAKTARMMIEALGA